MGEWPNRATQFKKGESQQLGKIRPAIGKRKARRLRSSLATVITEGSPLFSGDALDLFRTIYKDPAQPLEMRLAAARAASSFERPTLAATASLNGDRLTLEKLVTEAAKLAANPTAPLIEHDDSDAG